MKLARRRPVETVDGAAGQPVAHPAPPAPPRGAPVVAFAGVLDGRSLWLAVEARPGSLALRDARSGDVVALSSDVPEDQPRYRSTRVDLAGLAAEGIDDVAYDVVLVPSSGRAPRPAWCRPLPPAVSPVVDGVRWELQRSPEGTLRLLRSTPAQTAELVQIAAVDGGVAVVATPGGELALTGESGEVVTTFADSVLTVRALADVTAQPTQVTVGGRPVRRRDNDLLDPGRAVPLPELYALEPGLEDRVRLRLRWSGEGILTARILDPEADQS